MVVYEHLAGVLPARGRAHRTAAPYARIDVVGPDAADFLHRLCSQEILGMVDGELRPAAFLSPKGKLVATAYVGRVGDAVWIEVQAGQADTLAALLDRYHFTERLTIARPDGLVCTEWLGLTGGDWDALGGPPPGRFEASATGVTFAGARHGVRWLRHHGPAGDPGALAAAAGEPSLDPEVATCLRQLAGLVAVGVETEENTLGLEAALDDHVATDKGCYTGQEIVARIHTYGHVNRTLALFRIATAEPVERGAPLIDVDDGEPVGRVLAAGPIPGRDDQLAVGFLPEVLIREPVPLALGSEDGPAVQLEALSPA
ncbi:MAG: YgfZ/GcvT domain-containing protein [Planctomycetota bacterium]